MRRIKTLKQGEATGLCLGKRLPPIKLRGEGKKREERGGGSVPPDAGVPPRGAPAALEKLLPTYGRAGAPCQSGSGRALKLRGTCAAAGQGTEGKTIGGPRGEAAGGVAEGVWGVAVRWGHVHGERVGAGWPASLRRPVQPAARPGRASGAGPCRLELASAQAKLGVPASAASAGVGGRSGSG